MAKKLTQKKATKKTAKKRVAKKKAVKKKAVKKKAASKKTAAKKKKPAAKKKSVTKKTKVKRTKSKQAASKKGTKKKAVAIGRPGIRSDADLDLVFKEDFPARQIFTFLRVKTVKELEQFTAKQIIKQLTAPVTGTVERIRRRLADNNRCLAEDDEYLQQLKASEG